MAKTVGIREAKTRFSHFVDVARSGREVVITDRGRPVARLVAVGPAMDERSDADVLDDLDGMGLLERATRKLSRPSRPVKPSVGTSAAAIVREMRR